MSDRETRERQQDDQLDTDLNLDSLDDIALDDPEAGLGTSSKGKRKPDSPTKQMIIEGLKGTGAGVMSSIKGELYKAVPNLESVAGEISQTYSEFRDLKDELGRTLGPMLISLETSAHKVLPKAKAFLPKKLYAAIDRKLSERAANRASFAYRPQAKEQLEAETISNELAAIFTQQQEIQRDTAVEAKKSELLSMAVEGARHKQTATSLTHIYDAQRSVELFHRTIHTAYMKKSLELKYKHLFIARDTYNLLARSLATFETYFKAIEKNTMLPDMAKAEIGDFHRRNVTQRYGEMMADFMGNIRKRLFDNIKNTARSAVGNIGMFTDMAAMGADMSTMMDSMSPQPTGPGARIARLAGLGLGKLIGGPTAKRLLSKISPITNDLNKSLSDLKAHAAIKLSSLSRKWATSDNPVLTILSNMIPQLSVRSSGENALLAKPDAPTAFDMATRQSIVEIIPGYLSRILHSMEKMRTGDDDIDQTVYNAYTRKFTSIRDLEKSVNQRMYGSDDTRAHAFASTMGILEAGYKHAGHEDVEEYYKDIKPDINRFMINHGIYREGLRLDDIAKYVVSGGTAGNMSYIDRVCEGFSHNRIEVLQAIIDGLKNADGTWNKRSVSNLTSQLVEYMRNDTYTTELVNVGEKLGYRHLFSDKVDTKTRRAMESAARAGDTRAAAALRRTTSLFGDENELGLGRIAEGQANIDYQSAEQYIPTYTDSRMADLVSADEAHDQIKQFAKKSGIAKAYRFARRKYHSTKANAGDEIKRKYSKASKVGAKLAKKAADAINKAAKKSGKKVYESVPPEVREALDSIKTRVASSTEEAKEALDRILKAYGDHIPDSIKAEVDAIRSDIKKYSTASSVGANIKDELKKAAEKAADIKRDTTTSAPESAEKDTTRVVNGWEDLLAEYEKRVGKTRPSTHMSQSTAREDTSDETVPTGTSTPKVSPIVTPSEDIITGPEPAKTKGHDTESTAADTSVFDLLQEWYNTYKYNAEFNQTQLQEIKDYMSDEHGTIFDAIAQIDKTLHSGVVGAHSGVVGAVGTGYQTGQSHRAWLFDRLIKRPVKLAAKGARSVGTGLLDMYSKVYGGALSGAGSAIGGIGSMLVQSLGKGGFISKAGKTILRNIPNIVDTTGKAFKTIGKGYVNLYGKAIGAAGDVGKAVARGLFGGGGDPYIDIYRKDEIGGTYKPILTKVRQERGVYYKDGKRVERSSDIREPVYDSEHKEIISAEDIAHGLVDINNKPIRSSTLGNNEGLISKAFSAIKGAAPGVGGLLNTIGKIYGKTYSGLLDLLMGGAKGVGKGTKAIMSRLFGFDVGGASKQLISLVTLIQQDVDLIARGERKGTKAGDKDGDGDIDGSYEDQKSKRKEKTYKKADAREDHRDVNWRKKKEESKSSGSDDEEGGLLDGVSKSKWFKKIKSKVSKNKWVRHGGRRFKALGKLTGKRSLGVLGKVFTGGKAGFAKVATHLGTKLPFLGSVLGAGSAAAGTAGAGAAAGAAAGTAGTATAAGLGGTLLSALGPAALATLASYGIYRGVKGFGKKNTLENLATSNGISNENQLTGEDRMYSALGLNTKLGARVIKGMSKFIGLDGLIKGIRGNDNPLTDKEIQQGRTRLQRKIDKGLPGYDRILQEYEKAIAAGNWERARQLSGQQADGLIKSLWKNSIGGMITKGLGNLIFGDKNVEMSQSEIDKVHAKFNSIISKGGSGAKAAEKLLNRFDDAVADGDWKRARDIAGMEKQGIFGKLFKDSKGNVQWTKVIGTATFGVAGYLAGALFSKADVNKPMTEKEVADARARLMKLEQNGNKAAGKLLTQFDDAVVEMNWKKARQLVGREVMSNLVKLGRGIGSTVKWITRIGTLGLSTLFESDQEKPLTESEIEKVTKKLTYLAETKHNKSAAKKLEKFQEAVAQEKWDVARKIAKMPDRPVIDRAVKATISWFIGNDEKEMTEQEMNKFRDSCNRKINIGGSVGKAAQKKLEAFEDAVSSQNWRRARKIAKAPDDGILQKYDKFTARNRASIFRFFFGGDGKPMSEGEIEKARKRLSGEVSDGKRGAQKRLDMFEDYVADEKWDKARKLANMHYRNVVHRRVTELKNLIFGDNDKAMTPEEIKKFQDKCEQQIADGDTKMQKVLDRFNSYVESERWEQARAISNNKNWGLVGAVGKGIKNVLKFLTGSSDYEDCQKIKTKVEDKILDDGDPTGLMSKGLTQMETLIRREKYNDAALLGRSILKMKPTELADKFNLESDEMAELTKNAKSINELIQQGIKKQKGFFNFNRVRLRGLSNLLMDDPNKWSDEFFEDIRSRYAEITGEDEYMDTNAPSKDEAARAEKLIKDIDATSKNFGWFTSPIKKTRLSRLKSEIEGEPNDWYDLKFEEWQNRLNEIAGDKVVDSSALKPQPETTRAQQQVKTVTEQTPATEQIQTKPEPKVTEHNSRGDDPETAAEAAGLENAWKEQTAKQQPKPKSNSGYKITMRTVNIAGDPVGETLTPKQVGAIRMAESMGSNLSLMYSPDVLEKYRAARAASASSEESISDTYTGDTTEEFHKGGFATQTTPAMDTDGKPIVYGEAGTEAIMPIRSKPGNLLDKVGKKLGALMSGRDIGPVGDSADKASVHAADPDSEPMTNLLATELAKSAEQHRAFAEGGFTERQKEIQKKLYGKELTDEDVRTEKAMDLERMLHDRLTEYDNYRTARKSLEDQIAKNNSFGTKLKGMFGMSHDDGTMYDEDGNATTVEQQLAELEKSRESDTYEESGVINHNLGTNQTWVNRLKRIRSDEEFDELVKQYQELRAKNMRGEFAEGGFFRRASEVGKKAATSSSVDFSRPKPTVADPSLSGPVLQAKVANTRPVQSLPQFDPTETLLQQSALTEQLISQNKQLLSLLQAVCTAEGLKVAGMDTLTEVTAASASSTPTIINNTTVVSDDSSTSGLDLRKRQC